MQRNERSLAQSSSNNILALSTASYIRDDLPKNPLYDIIILLTLGFSACILTIIGFGIFWRWGPDRENNQGDSEEVELEVVNLNQNGHHSPIGDLEAVVMDEAPV